VPWAVDEACPDERSWPSRGDTNGTARSVIPKKRSYGPSKICSDRREQRSLGSVWVRVEKRDGGGRGGEMRGRREYVEGEG